MSTSQATVEYREPKTSRESEGSGYTSPTWWYDLRGFGILKFSYRGRLGSQLSFFEKNLKNRHLEVAIGTGTLFQMVLKRRARRGPLPEKIVGVDYSPRMLEGAKHKFRNMPDVTLLDGDVASLPFPDHAFDSVNIANALHCFSDVGSALKEIRRVLAPGCALAANVLLHPEGSAPARKIAAAILSSTLGS